MRHLGFSCHSDAAGLKEFLDEYGEHMEFCQIQLNYLDWTLQGAKDKVALLRERGIPVWVMEPVRGGRLAKLDEETEMRMRALRPEESTAAWAFRWLRTVPQPTVILSGMSNLSQMKDNVATFEQDKPLNDEELQVVYDAAERLSALIPCTGCRYCCAGCPKQLNIPLLISLCNDMRIDSAMNAVARYDALDDKRATACIGCGKCEKRCTFGYIKFNPVNKKPTIDQQACLGCGLCVSTCPTKAITLRQKSEDKLYTPPPTYDDAMEIWERDTKKNYDRFK